jgi:hypothetical protein
MNIELDRGLPLGDTIRKSIFPTELIVSQIHNIDNFFERLLKAIIEHRKSSQVNQMLEKVIWESSNNFFDWNADTEFLKKVISDSLRLAVPIKENQKVRLHGSAIVLQYGGYTEPRTNERSNVSGIFFLDVGQTDTGGTLSILDPRTVSATECALDMGIPCRGGAEFIHPETGNLVLFPSWLKTWITPVFAKKPKVFIRFSAKILQDDIGTLR